MLDGLEHDRTWVVEALYSLIWMGPSECLVLRLIDLNLQASFCAAKTGHVWVLQTQSFQQEKWVLYQHVKELAAM